MTNDQKQKIKEHKESKPGCFNFTFNQEMNPAEDENSPDQSGKLNLCEKI